DHQGALGPAGHHPRVVDHLFQRDAQRIRLALHDHAERIADEQAVSFRGVEQPGGRIVVSGQDRQLGAVFLGGNEIRRRDWFARRVDKRGSALSHEDYSITAGPAASTMVRAWWSRLPSGTLLNRSCSASGTYPENFS